MDILRPFSKGHVLFDFFDGLWSCSNIPTGKDCIPRSCFSYLFSSYGFEYGSHKYNCWKKRTNHRKKTLANFVLHVCHVIHHHLRCCNPQPATKQRLGSAWHCHQPDPRQSPGCYWKTSPQGGYAVAKQSEIHDFRPNQKVSQHQTRPNFIQPFQFPWFSMFNVFNSFSPVQTV